MPAFALLTTSKVQSTELNKDYFEETRGKTKVPEEKSSQYTAEFLHS